ncbi:MAG: Cys-tRNA(Pro) deacylase [Erysipelotrichaceae bacterium]|nr:Cys-tRNA(Pro) deacylase [Erysipelotrichaceae bacterium]MBO4538178.1 Cys-tRNA(Pro) deacylase [Erysipelotrichaceae bacterium]
MNKTNALRKLDEAGISYQLRQYPVDESDLSGQHVAEVLGEDPQQIFKTLVCRDEKNAHFVFCIPVNEELDLKKCAAACGSKRVEMIPLKELLPLTGYLRGGCSPVGMKKPFPTFMDETAILFDAVYLSAGQRGLQMLVDPQQLMAWLNGRFAELTR